MILLPFVIISTTSTRSSSLFTMMSMMQNNNSNDVIISGSSSSSSAVVSFASPDHHYFHLAAADSGGDNNNKDSSTSTSSSSITSILIILNMPIHPQHSLSFERLWHCSQRRICADGGANRLYQYNPQYIPDRIRGDLDSLDHVVRAYYETQNNVIIERDPCQDTNDLDKALQVCALEMANQNNDDNAGSLPHPTPRIYIYGAFGGRFDQEMASFAALYKWAPQFQWQVYLYSEETCAFLLPAERPCEIRMAFWDGNEPHDFSPDSDGDASSTDNNLSSDLSVGEGPTCGLIPLSCRCESITTTGLKWDLDGTIPLEFGGLVSTSNRIMKSVVSTTASHPVIFTAELQRCRKRPYR